MRWIVPIVMALAGVGWLLSVAEPAGFGAAQAKVDRHPADDWRRTAQGWERSADWAPPPIVRRPPFHPGLLAAFEIWSAAAALLLASRHIDPHPPAAGFRPAGLRVAP